MDFKALTLTNDNAIDAAATKLQGFAKIFVPKGTTSGVILPHPRNPSETVNKEEKVIPTAQFGKQRDLKKFTTKVSVERTYETLGSGDAVVRGLHSGGEVFDAATGAGADAKIIIENRELAYGMIIDIYLDAEKPDENPAEIYVAPNVALEGDGIASGRDGANETALKFKETIFSPEGYVLPTSIGSLTNKSVEGGFFITGVDPDKVQAVVESLITGVNPPA